MAMTESNAASLADKYIENILRSQPTFWPHGGMGSEAVAKQLAKNLAAFRLSLVEELKKQV